MRTYPRTFSLGAGPRVASPGTPRRGRLEFYRARARVRRGRREPHRLPRAGRLDLLRSERASWPAAPRHPARRRPEDYGFARAKRDWSARQGRNVVLTPDELLASAAPAWPAGYRACSIRRSTGTARTRRRSTPTSWRTSSGPSATCTGATSARPHVGRGLRRYQSRGCAERSGVNDGDYVWVDGDPADNPVQGLAGQGREAEYHVARLLCRARYYPGTPKGIMRMWHNGYMATPGSVKGHETRARRARQEPGDQLPGLLPLRLPPEPDALAGSSPRIRRARSSRGGAHRTHELSKGFQRGRALRDGRAARGDVPRAPRPRTAASAARGSGARSTLGLRPTERERGHEAVPGRRLRRRRRQGIGRAARWPRSTTGRSARDGLPLRGGSVPRSSSPMIFDTNKCIACQTCTVACKTTWTPGRGQEYMYWNNVETQALRLLPARLGRQHPRQARRPGRWTGPSTTARRCSTPRPRAR